jgi:hypothetical protein
MEELILHVEKLVNAECARAQEKHGRGYASDHEAWAVMGEEIMEAEMEFEMVKDLHSDMQVNIWQHNKLSLTDILMEATRCACEMIQVAAVARKMMEGKKASYLDGAICTATKLPCTECVPGAPCSVKEKKDDQHTELPKVAEHDPDCKNKKPDCICNTCRRDDKTSCCVSHNHDCDDRTCPGYEPELTAAAAMAVFNEAIERMSAEEIEKVLKEIRGIVDKGTDRHPELPKTGDHDMACCGRNARCFCNTCRRDNASDEDAEVCCNRHNRECDAYLTPCPDYVPDMEG